MKNLTEAEKALLNQFAAELKAIIYDEQDYEGARIKEEIDGYVDVKCNPSNSVKGETIYHCNPKNDVDFLIECYQNGIFFVITEAGNTISIQEALDKLEDFQESEVEFMLAPTGDKMLMAADLKKGREDLPVIEYKANEGD